MMDIFFTDPSAVPLPPEDVRIHEFTAEPWSDGRRIKVYLEVTPFQKRPSGEVLITDIGGKPVAAANIIETIDPKMEINLHLRAENTSGEYQASVVLFYLQEIPDDEDENLRRPDRIVVDEAQTAFSIA
jgi:hypothetical protein